MGFDPDHAPAVLTPLILLINSDIIPGAKPDRRRCDHGKQGWGRG